jgi:hypothetical protein
MTQQPAAPDAVKVGQLIPCPLCNGPAFLNARRGVSCERVLCCTAGTVDIWNCRPNPTPAAPDGLLERLRVSAKWLASFVRDNVGGTGWDLAKIHCAEKHREEVAEAADLITAQAARLKALRSDIFAVLRAHDVSEQCFAEVAMITHAALKGEPT